MDAERNDVSIASIIIFAYAAAILVPKSVPLMIK